MRWIVTLGLVAMMLAGCGGGPDVPSAPPLQSGPASNTLFNPQEAPMDATAVAKAVCARLIECMGGQGLAKSCVEEMVRYTSFVIDGPSFVACFNSVSCADLERLGQIDDQIEGCLDLDPSSASCNGDTLRYCDRQGRCKDIRCSTFCELLTGTSGGSCVTHDDGPTCKCSKELDRLPEG